MTEERETVPDEGEAEIKVLEKKEDEADGG